MREKSTKIKSWPIRLCEEEQGFIVETLCESRSNNEPLKNSWRHNGGLKGRDIGREELKDGQRQLRRETGGGRGGIERRVEGAEVRFRLKSGTKSKNHQFLLGRIRK